MSSTELHGGLFVADEAIRLACNLEARGFALTAKDGALLVSNGSALTATDRAGIVRLKRHLLAIAAYEVPT